MDGRSSDDHLRLIIIGSGAGGATLAQRLAPTGKSILILERGEHLPREAENWNPKAVFIDHNYRTKEQWYDKRGKPFIPNTHYWVGGNTTFYGAALMRLRKGDFEETPARRRRLAGLADPSPTSRPTTPRPRRSGGCTASAASTRPRTATSRPTPIRRSTTIRASAAEGPSGEPGLAAVLACRWASTSTRPIRSPRPASAARPAAAIPAW